VEGAFLWWAININLLVGQNLWLGERRQDMSRTKLSRLAERAPGSLCEATIAKPAGVRALPRIRRGIADKCFHRTTILSDNPNGELGQRIE